MLKFLTECCIINIPIDIRKRDRRAETVSRPIALKKTDDTAPFSVKSREGMRENAGTEKII